MWIDSHCHLKSFFDRSEGEAVLQRAREAGVERLITIGTSLKDWDFYARLAAEYPDFISWTVGLHPSDVDDDWSDQVAAISTFFATDPQPVALGEVGLDYFRLPKYPDEAAEVKSRQQAAFRKQLSLAYQFGCPVVVHSRSAFEDTVRLIDESGIRWSNVVFHCFVEEPESLQALVERGGRASFTGIVTYKNKSSESVRASALKQGTESLMVETDAPYLSPEPVRGDRNEPANVVHTGKFLAGIMGEAPVDLARRTTANSRAFFNLP